MTAPFVTSLRTQGAPVTVGGEAGDVLHLRVEVPEVWETIRVNAAPSEPVLAVKVGALHALFPDPGPHASYVVKLNGKEILDENAALVDVGAMDGSTLLLTSRRRRPVR